MNYNDLQELANSKKILMRELAVQMEMTYAGMKTAIENQTLSVKKIILLCEALGITPNQFFGWEDGKCASQVQNGGVGNMQRINYSSAAALQEQLRIKDEQIQNKDAQIAKLLEIVSAKQSK